MAARVTGQYSRLGALMDPVIDRLLAILAGVVVCWHFELLPRWALAVLVAREAAACSCSAAARLRTARTSCTSTGPAAGRVVAADGGHRSARVRADVAPAIRASTSGLALSLWATVLYVPSRRMRRNCRRTLNVSLTVGARWAMLPPSDRSAE